MVSKVNKLANDISSSSAFMDTAAFSAEWTDIQLLQRRSHNVIYTASRYGRRFLLKGLTQEAANLSDFRLMQEKEFRLGISLSHPHIATTYGLEEVPELGRCISSGYTSDEADDPKAYSAGFEDYSNCQKYFNTLRDSLTASFDENDPLREQFWQIWVRRETELHNELLPIMTGKLH